MNKEEFKKLAEEHLFILEGYNLDKEGNKEMKIYGFDALFEQLTIPAVVGQSEQLKCEHKGRRTATELVEYCEDCKKILYHP